MLAHNYFDQINSLSFFPLLLLQDIMAETVALHSAFGSIGSNAATQNAIVAQGVANILDLCMFDKDGVTHLCKALRKVNPTVDRAAAADIVDIPHIHQLKLEAMVYWTKEQFCLGLPTAAANFTNARAITYHARMLTDAEEASIKNGPSTAPEKFLEAQTWTVFRKAFITYLGRFSVAIVHHWDTSSVK
jgi:hypothetical protein